MKNETTKYYLLILLLVLAILPLSSALTLSSGTIITNNCLNTNYTLTKTLTVDKVVVNSTCAGDINNLTAFYNPINLSIKNVGSTIGTIQLYNLSNSLGVKDITNNQLLFVSSTVNNQYNATFNQNVIISTTTSITPPTPTIVLPTTTDMNFYTPTLSVSLDTYGSCKYNINNGANHSLGSGLFFNKVLTVPSGQTTISVFCNNSILSTESKASVSFWVYVSNGQVGTTTTYTNTTINNTITLLGINISNKKWFYKNNNSIDINIFGINNKSIDPESILVYSTINGTIQYGKIIRNSVGEYSIYFNKIYSNITDINIHIIITDKLKVINKLYNVKLHNTIKDNSFFGKLKHSFNILSLFIHNLNNTITDYFNNIFNMNSSPTYYLVLFVLILISIILLFKLINYLIYLKI